MPTVSGLTAAVELVFVVVVVSLELRTRRAAALTLWLTSRRLVLKLLVVSFDGEVEEGEGWMDGASV